MTLIRIELTDTSTDHPARLEEMVGKIQIATFSEGFHANAIYWSSSDYIEHWKRARSRLLDGSDRGCFITSITAPDTANFVLWWIYYRDSDNVIFQNHVLMLEGPNRNFDVEAPEKCIPERRSYTEDGWKVSEWRVAFLGIDVQVG